MKAMLSSRIHHYMKRVGIFLIAGALIIGMTGCEATPAPQYDLIISSTTGGWVTTPGEGTFTYDYGTLVDLVATPDGGYPFVNWTGDVGTIADVDGASTTITIAGDYTITANFGKEIRNWYDLDGIRDNLGGSYVLMNNLDSTTTGYAELAGPTANGGKGWQPIGNLLVDPFITHIVDAVEPFVGSFDGQGYQISDLFINRPDQHGVGIFSSVDEEGAVENLGLVNAEVTGHAYVGGLAGVNDGGTVRNSYFSGTITGRMDVGGLAGANWGTVSNSYSTGSVTGSDRVGGLVASNWGIVSNSHSTGSTTGHRDVGGLVGLNWHGTVSDSYSTGSVTAEWSQAGGLVGENLEAVVSNSYYDYDEVLINGESRITIGALFSEDFQQWLANGRFLDVNERLSQEDDYYVIGDFSDFKELLAFGQDGSLKFRLEADLDLGNHPNFYIPYLAGEFHGNGHKISNLSFNCAFVSHVGLFGYVASSGKVSQVGVENANITGSWYVGGLVGNNQGTVSNSCLGGRVSGHQWRTGGLVGVNSGTVRNSCSTGSVSGAYAVGGLVGTQQWGGTVSNSYSTGNVTGDWAVGGLVGLNEGGTVSRSYSSGSVDGGANTGGLIGESFWGTASNSFWDKRTSGMEESDGGTGKTTAEMQNVATFAAAEWSITAVASGVSDPAYIWNIVAGQTYPFLSWQSVS